MLAIHGLAVIARQNDDQVFAVCLFTNVIDELTDVFVGKPDLAVVRRARLVSRGLRGIQKVRRTLMRYVLRVRIEVVNPQEEPRRARVSVEKLDGRVRELRARRVRVRVRLPRRRHRRQVEGIESLRQSPRAGNTNTTRLPS